MFVLQSNRQTDPGTGIAYIFGLLIPLAILGMLGSLFIQLGAKLVAKKSVGFGKPFWISFFALVAAFITQTILRRSSDSTPELQNSIIRVIPAVVFFLMSWLLNSQFIRYGDDENSQSYGKALVVTIIQSVCLMIVGLVFVLALRGLVFK